MSASGTSISKERIFLSWFTCKQA